MSRYSSGFFGATFAPWRHIQPIDQPRQHESQRRASRQHRQRLDLGLAERPQPLIAGNHRPAFGDVERIVGLEAPGAEADRQIVGERIVAREVEVDEAGKLVAKEKHVVVEKIRMDDAAGRP